MPSRLSAFHEGEAAMRQVLKVPPGMNPTSVGLPVQYGMRVMQSPLVALGTLDAQGRPWTTVWGGERGFAQPIADGVLGLNSAVDAEHDPVFKALWAGADDKGIVQAGPGGKMMSALSIDLMTRDRVKLAGSMIAGAHTETGDVQMAMLVAESLGNCPKYLNKKDIRRRDDGKTPELVSESLPLGREALELVDAADMIFLSSTNGETMDTNHRGGSPGFVRVVRNGEGGVEIVYPEFSGNRLYQTLGNLKVNPLVGVVVPDFNTSNVLYLTGTASILIGEEASSLIARTQLAVKISVSATRFVKSGLPFYGVLGDYSPYNPPVRRLFSEQNAPLTASSGRSDITANLVKRESISPSISAFTFELSSRDPLPAWRAGQHITFDFEPELGVGYSHMREDDPQGLNDDLVRTFTVSSPPGWGPKSSKQLQITARRNGPATNFLWRHNMRVPLELPVLGFGGEEAFWLPTKAGEGLKPVFIAGGVGITPLLAQARGVLDGGVPLRLLWSLRGEDLALAIRAFDSIPGLAAATTLFVTGGGGADEGTLEKAKERGAEAQRRRIARGDVSAFSGSKFYVCAGQGLLGLVRGWVDGEEVVTEDFGY